MKAAGLPVIGLDRPSRGQAPDRTCAVSLEPRREESASHSEQALNDDLGNSKPQSAPGGQAFFHGRSQPCLLT